MASCDDEKRAFLSFLSTYIIANIGNEIKDLIKDLLPKIHFVQSLFSDEAIITAFSKGWGDVWKNLKVQLDDEKSGVKIFYNSQIVGIKRDKIVSKKVKTIKEEKKEASMNYCSLK